MEQMENTIVDKKTRSGNCLNRLKRLVKRLKFWKRNRNQVNKKSNIDSETEVNDANDENIQSDDQQNHVHNQIETTVQEITEKTNTVEDSISNNIKTEDLVFDIDRDSKQKSFNEIVLTSGNFVFDDCEHFWPASICPICEYEMELFERTKENCAQELSKSVDDWSLTTQNAESDQSIGSSIFGTPEDSDWICMTSEDSSSSMFSALTDSDCNSVTSKDLGSHAFDVPQDCDCSSMTSEDWSSSVFSAGTDSDCNSVTSEDLGFSAFGIPPDSDWTTVTSQHLKCPKATQNGETKTCEELAQDLASHYYAKLDYNFI
jgi:hypothetical protein